MCRLRKVENTLPNSRTSSDVLSRGRYTSDSTTNPPLGRGGSTDTKPQNGDERIAAKKVKQTLNNVEKVPHPTGQASPLSWPCCQDVTLQPIWSRSSLVSRGGKRHVKPPRSQRPTQNRCSRGVFRAGFAGVRMNAGLSTSQNLKR